MGERGAAMHLQEGKNGKGLQTLAAPGHSHRFFSVNVAHPADHGVRVHRQDRTGRLPRDAHRILRKEGRIRWVFVCGGDCGLRICRAVRTPPRILHHVEKGDAAPPQLRGGHLRQVPETQQHAPGDQCQLGQDHESGFQRRRAIPLGGSLHQPPHMVSPTVDCHSGGRLDQDGTRLCRRLLPPHFRVHSLSVLPLPPLRAAPEHHRWHYRPADQLCLAGRPGGTGHEDERLRAPVSGSNHGGTEEGNLTDFQGKPAQSPQRGHVLCL
mmetsp:Transcript_26600/g.73169  ORF Transcript_26600/g.73169 Transcript_26600/m.73169 type:complete len:267 (+) Transcript_26600:1010-1810(+)